MGDSYVGGRSTVQLNYTGTFTYWVPVCARSLLDRVTWSRGHEILMVGVPICDGT